LAKRGLEIAGDGATRYALTCLQGDILRELGESEESIEAFARALQFAADDMQHSKAWIGQAEAMRIVDRYKEALAALDKAEGAVGAAGCADQLTRIHFLRGNLYFPLGKIDGCSQQHELALQYARNAGLVEDETRALGGLGDAYYQRGLMITAHKYFRDCVELSRQHGFRSIEVANLPMVGASRFYINELGGALKDALTTIEGAKKIGHHRAELMGHTGACRTFIQMVELDAAEKHLCEAETLVARIGARRFGAMTLIFRARILRLKGRRLEALKQCEKALIISRETGIGFAGPQVLAELALNADERTTRWEALQEGVNILQQGAVSHNHFNFYADAMDAYLESKEWEEVERCAAALEEFTRPEPLPWCDFFIARGRTLAAYGRGNREGSIIEELRRLRDQAESIGLRRALPALEAALTIS
jgi:tetratricopeptide (TPR) repeat protein